MLHESQINDRAFSYYARLRRVREYVHRHLSEALPLGAAARIAAMNEKYFSTFFHAKTGLRYTEWLNSVRINRAVELMTERNYSISAVAAAVGYRDLRTFERAFKKRTAMTPRAYKRSIRPS
jgi:AraC-like DNA-binding protein